MKCWTSFAGNAGYNTLFKAVNRPLRAIIFDRPLDGLRALRKGFRGAYWLEVLLLVGYTGMEAEVKKIEKRTAEIRPDRVHLNTCCVRPPAEEFVFMDQAFEREGIDRMHCGKTGQLSERKLSLLPQRRT